MIVESFAADCTCDGASRRLANKGHDIPHKVVVCRRAVESQIEPENHRATAVDYLEGVISSSWRRLDDAFGEQLTPSVSVPAGLIPRCLQLARPLLRQDIEQSTDMNPIVPN